MRRQRERSHPENLTILKGADIRDHGEPFNRVGLRISARRLSGPQGFGADRTGSDNRAADFLDFRDAARMVIVVVGDEDQSDVFGGEPQGCNVYKDQRR